MVPKAAPAGQGGFVNVGRTKAAVLTDEVESDCETARAARANHTGFYMHTIKRSQ